jgi:ATP-dependent exoDNAse (exonuclease V) alpha subunit
MVERMVDELKADRRGYGGTYHHRYIAYKNVNVREVGKQIRDKVLEHYFGFNFGSVPFIQGELIMMRENKGSIGFNGELVEVVKVSKDRRFQSLNPYLWDSYDLTVKGSLGTGLIRTIPPCSQKIMDGHIEKLQGKLRKYQIENDIVSAKEILNKIKQIRSYWTTTQYPYAVTTHKSQGMTIENVYLNTTSFVSAPNKRALLYVGISRAAMNLHTVKVSPEATLDRAEVNSRYREAKESYKAAVGKPFRNLLGFSTRTLVGKDLMTGYIEAVVADLAQ